MSDFPTEFIEFQGLPHPVKKVRRENPRPRERETHPGFHDYKSERQKTLVLFYGHPGFPTLSRAGIPSGYTRKTVAQAWATAKELARKDMDIIKKAFPTTDEIVEEATMLLLTNIRGPVDDGIKLASAKTLLDFYKEKPRAKTSMTVSTIDTWMESLEDKSRDDD